MYVKIAVSALFLSSLAGVTLVKEGNRMAWIRGNAMSRNPASDANAAVRKLSELWTDSLTFLDEIEADSSVDMKYESGFDSNKFNHHWDMLIYGLHNVLHRIEGAICAIGLCLHDLHADNLHDLVHELNECGHDILDALNSMECMHMNNTHNHTRKPTPMPTDDMGGTSPPVPEPTPPPVPEPTPPPSSEPSCLDNSTICDGAFIACDCCPPENIEYYYYKYEVDEDKDEYELPDNNVCDDVDAAVKKLRDCNYTINDSSALAGMINVEGSQEEVTVTLVGSNSWIVNNATNHKAGSPNQAGESCFPGSTSDDTCSNEVVFTKKEKDISNAQVIFARCELD